MQQLRDGVASGASNAGSGVVVGPNSAFPAVYSLGLCGTRFVDAREFQRRYRRALDSKLKSLQVWAALDRDVCVCVRAVSSG